MRWPFFKLPALLRTHRKVQHALATQRLDQVLTQFKSRRLLELQTPSNMALAAFFTRCLRRYAGRFRRPSACLDQAIALQYFLTEQGIAAELKIGVKRSPFAAHAWIEVSGAPVLEPANIQSDFICFEQLPEGTIALLNPIKDLLRQ